MSKNKYDFKEVEAKWLKFWDKEKVYKFKPGKNIYSIDMPPPTLSGKMHIGHSYSYSQQDFIARFHRISTLLEQMIMGCLQRDLLRN